MSTPVGSANILLFGETGNGKSTLGNYILGVNAFRVSNDVKSETKTTIGQRGEGDNKGLFVIDTPGLQDTQGADKEHMIQMVNYIKEKKVLNAIIVVFNYQQVRFPYNIQTMLKLFCNIFPMKDVGSHIALVFTNSFTKKGSLRPEQKKEKLDKVLPEFKRVIEEASGTKINNIVSGFVDMDPEDGLDENGKMDLDRIITWACNLDNLNLEKINTPEPDVRIETQDFDDMKIEGEYIIKTTTKRERKVFSQLDGTITYGEWKDVEKNTEKILNPEIEKIRKLNIDQEQKMKLVQEENEKRIKQIQEENRNMQEKTHKELLEMIASNKKSQEAYELERRRRDEEERRRREDDERRIREEKDEKRREKLERELEEKKEKQKEKEKRRKFLEQKLIIILNTSRNNTEGKMGKCQKINEEFKAGITEEDDLVKLANLTNEECEFKVESSFMSIQEKKLEKTFSGKTIVGWKIKSEHENENGGSWIRNSTVLGTSSYSFTFYTNRWRGCNWKLSIWYVDSQLPFDIE